MIRVQGPGSRVQGAESDSSSRLLQAAPALFIGGNKISAVVSALGRFETIGLILTRSQKMSAFGR